MNKKFTPLEALRQMSAYRLEMGVAIKDLPNYDIIETALKDYEELQNRYDELFKNKVEMSFIYARKLKALDIIKEKPAVALVDYKYTYEEWLELVDEKDKDLFKNKEEYDLLKEELL